MSTDEAYPTVVWVKSQLRNNVIAPRRVKVLAAYIVGSEARGTAGPDSDLDIAVVIPPVRGKTSLRYSEEYHARFASEQFKPQWQDRKVDFQFFYPGDAVLEGYAKIELAPGVRGRCDDAGRER